MKRTGLLWAVVILAVLAAACSPSPKARGDELARYIPAEIEGWERDDDGTVKLLSSTVSSKGEVIMTYQGEDDAIAYLVIEVHPSTDVADVAYTERIRELQLAGLTLDKNRAPQQVTADVGQQGRMRYALLQQDEIVVEINTIAASEESPVSDEGFEPLLDITRRALEKIAEDS